MRRGIPGTLAPASTPGLCPDEEVPPPGVCPQWTESFLQCRLKGVAPVKTCAGGGAGWGVEFGSARGYSLGPQGWKAGLDQASAPSIRPCPNSIPAPLTLPPLHLYIETPGMSKGRRFWALKLPTAVSVGILNPFLFLGYGGPTGCQNSVPWAHLLDLFVASTHNTVTTSHQDTRSLGPATYYEITMVTYLSLGASRDSQHMPLGTISRTISAFCPLQLPCNPSPMGAAQVWPLTCLCRGSAPPPGLPAPAPGVCPSLLPHCLSQSPGSRWG